MFDIELIPLIIIICILFFGSIINYESLTLNNYIYNFFVPSMIAIFIYYKQCDSMDFLWIMVMLAILYGVSRHPNKDKVMFSNESTRKKLQKVAKKYNIPHLTFEHMITYVNKFNKKEQCNMFLHRMVKDGFTYHYITNKNDNTLILFSRIKNKQPNYKIVRNQEKLKAFNNIKEKGLQLQKEDKEDRQLEKIKKMLNEDDMNNEKVTKNIKFFEETINIFKDYDFDENTKEEMKIKNHIELLKKCVNIYHQNKQEITKSDTDVKNNQEIVGENNNINPINENENENENPNT